jgi:DNA-directed RNA polymerase specialized sigma24 family protein
MDSKTLKKHWTITPNAFQNMLSWLDNRDNSNGERYLEIRRRLVYFFDRKDCRNSDELADETLNRVARRLEEEGKIETETPEKFCYIMAKFVFMESLRAKEKQNISIDEVFENKLVTKVSGEENLNELRLNCLESCTSNLENSNRKIIFGYYYGEERIKIENRKSLAKKFEISVNALSIRACRIREKLQGCVNKCVEKNNL